MDDPFFIFMIVALVAFIVAWIWLSRRGKVLREQQRQQRDEAVPEVFDRRMLVSRPREFDPSAWDDSPDESVGRARKAGTKAGPAASATPTPVRSSESFVLDRAFLEARRQPQPPVPPAEKDSE